MEQGHTRFLQDQTSPEAKKSLAASEGPLLTTTRARTILLQLPAPNFGRPHEISTSSILSFPSSGSSHRHPKKLKCSLPADGDPLALPSPSRLLGPGQPVHPLEPMDLEFQSEGSGQERALAFHPSFLGGIGLHSSARVGPAQSAPHSPRAVPGDSVAAPQTRHYPRASRTTQLKPQTTTESRLGLLPAPAPAPQPSPCLPRRLRAQHKHRERLGASSAHTKGSLHRGRSGAVTCLAGREGALRSQRNVTKIRSSQGFGSA